MWFVVLVAGVALGIKIILSVDVTYCAVQILVFASQWEVRLVVVKG